MGMEKPNKMSRRNFLRDGIALAGAVALGRGLTRHEIEKQKTLDDVDSSLTPLPTLEHAETPQEYIMGDLAGHKFAAELSSYTGIKGEVPERARISFAHQLEEMWSNKMQSISAIGGDAMPIVDFGQEMVTSYNPDHHTSMTLGVYEKNIQHALHEVRLSNFDLIRKIPSFAKCTDQQVQLIQHFESAIDARTLLTYALTEIMPTSGRDSIVGVQLFDFLLRNAGSEYIDRIPAGHDSFLSFGPYQFTRYAIGDVANQHNGASVMNKILTTPQLPAYVGDMRGADHHKAAYLLALYNIAHLVEKLGHRQSEKLLHHFNDLPKDTVLEYVATAHHLPSASAHSFKKFTGMFLWKYGDKNTKKHSHSISNPTFASVCATSGIGQYCQKTKSNSEALKTFFSSV